MLSNNYHFSCIDLNIHLLVKPEICIREQCSNTIFLINSMLEDDSHWIENLCYSKVLNSTTLVPVLGGNPSCTKDVHAMLPLFSYSTATGRCRNYAISHAMKEAPGCVPTHDVDRCSRIRHALKNHIMKQSFVGAFERHDIFLCSSWISACLLVP